MVAAARDHSVRAIAGRRFSWHNSIGSTSGWGAPGAFHALANSFAFADFCGAVRRNARGLGAIADFLPLVFAQRPVEHEQLLLHQQRAMPADDFRNWRLLLAKPLSSAFAPGPDQAVTLSSPGWRAVQLLNEPSRQVGAHQSRAVRAKPSASTGERMSGSTSSGPGPNCEIDAMGHLQTYAVQRTSAAARTIVPLQPPLR